jgi:parallel beta-helix repeat protein
MKLKIAFPLLIASFTLMVSLLMPTTALADDGTPPTPEPASSELSDEQAPSGESGSSEEATAIEGTDAVTDELVTPQVAVETETVADVVETLGEVDAVLRDEDGDPISFATQEAAEVLGSSDPYFFDGVNWIGYSASGICPAIVTTCNTNSTPFQAAINAAPAGGTIFVEPGTYTEQLIINKSMVIQGSGSANTFIQAPAILNAGTNGERSIITITGATTSVDLAGFTVQGPGPGGCNSINYGIFVRDGANADIHDNTIDDIRDAPFGGCQNGIAIGVGRAAYGTSGTATIEDNTITDFQKGGIVVDNSGSNATIAGNTITGTGQTSIIAQNGIQISRNATAEVTDNTISDFIYLVPSGGTAWTSAGILLFQPGTTVVDGNTITDNNIGIYDYQSSNAVISDNTVSGSCSDEVGGGNCDHDGWGIYSYQSTNLEIMDNTLVDNVIGAGINDTTGTIAYNLFDGNETGMLNYGQSIVDATYNCWGSPSGPTHSSNPGGTGDVAGDDITFDPWECAPATGGGGGGTGVTPPSGGGIPVTGGQLIQISCEDLSVTLELEDVHVIFTGLCGYSVVLNNINQDALPAGIGDGNRLLNGLSIILFKGNQGKCDACECEHSGLLSAHGYQCIRS